jgi:hypothetical protein
MPAPAGDAGETPIDAVGNRWPPDLEGRHDDRMWANAAMESVVMPMVEGR